MPPRSNVAAAGAPASSRLFRFVLVLSTLTLLHQNAFALSEDEELIQRARKHIDKQELAKGLYFLECAEKLNRYNRAIYYNRGRIYNKQEKFNEAIQQFNHAIRLSPDYASAFKKRGEAHIERKETAQAIEDFSKAISLAPKDSESYDGRVRAYCDRNQHQLARKDIDTLIKLAPSRTNLVTRARICMKLGDYKQAITDLTKAASTEKRDDESYLLRAKCYEVLGKYDAAIADYTHILRFNAKDEMAYEDRANVYLKKGNATKAVEDYTNAIKYSPEPGSTLYHNRAAAYRKLGKNDLADQDEKHAN